MTSICHQNKKKKKKFLPRKISQNERKTEKKNLCKCMHIKIQVLKNMFQKWFLS